MKRDARDCRTFKTFEEAEEAEFEYYRCLSGDEKLELMLQIMAPYYEAEPRSPRVYRIIEPAEFEEAWKDRLPGHLEGLPVALINRELLLKNKLAAGRPKDLADVEALRRTAPKT